MSTILVFLAALPAIILLIYIYKQDKVEKEPIGLLAKLLLFGALSVITALIGETVGLGIISFIFPEGSMTYAYIECFLIVAICEEVGKYFAMKLGTWKSREFNYKFDGVVYGVCTSLGFAIVENILYVLDGGVSLAVTRGFTAVPAHAIFGVLMGLYYGRAKQCSAFNDLIGKKKNLRKALIIPIIFHGFYDFCLSVNSVMAVLTFFVLLIAMYVIAFISVKNASRSDEPVYPFIYYYPVAEAEKNEETNGNNI